MITKYKYVHFFLLILVVIIAAKCDHDENTILSVPITDYYDSCKCDDDYYFGDMFTIGDPNDKFMVRLPYHWDIRENYSDSVYGMQAGNFLSIPIEVKKRMFFMISGYNTELPLHDYYLNELKALKKEPNAYLKETGKTSINNVESYWVKFSSQDEVFHLVLYIKHPQLSDIYIMQASAYDSDKYNIKLCYMKQFFNSFEMTNIH